MICKSSMTANSWTAGLQKFRDSCNWYVKVTWQLQYMIADVFKFHDRRLFKVATQFVQLVNNVSKQFVNNFSVTYRRQLVMEFHRDSCLFHVPWPSCLPLPCRSDRSHTGTRRQKMVPKYFLKMAPKYFQKIRAPIYSYLLKLDHL